MSYRADIDGLRALAVGMVLLFHLGFPAISGGYIGVDIFFVISGYLITAVLNQLPHITIGDLGKFYNRRIKRLAPAFVLVAAITTILAGLLLIPEDFIHQIQSVRESLGYQSNVYFEHETTGYFAANAGELPWLHTWSLSVEWQFYIAYPLLLFGLQVARLPKRGLCAVLGLIGTVALLASIWLTATSPTRAYYSALARFFEFCAGGLANLISPMNISKRFANTVTTVGIVGLISLSFLFKKDTAFPGWNALLVCVLAVAVIATGCIASVLSFSWIAQIGRRSYSLYLWHWPPIAFLHYVQHALTLFEAALLTGAILLISDLTYRFIELPGIRSSQTLGRTICIWILLPLLISTGLYSVVRRHDGFPSRLGSESTHAYANMSRYSSLSGDRCHNYLGPDLDPCAIGDRASSEKGLLIGDSHAKSYTGFIDVMAKDAHLKVYGLTTSECLTLEGSRLPERFTDGAACQSAIARDLNLIRSGEYKYVILAERWIGYPPDQTEKLELTIRRIVDSGAIPVLIAPIAENGTNLKDCYYLHIKLRQPAGDTCSIQQDNPFGLAEKANVRTLIERMKSAFPGLLVIDPQAAQCSNSECIAISDGTPLYSDTHHLNEFGSITLARLYLSKFGNPFARRPD